MGLKFRKEAGAAASPPSNMNSGQADVVLFTRQGCHLCDEAARVLVRHGLPFSRVDIDTDPQLRARYNDCVPVVLVDGTERFRGRVDELLLRRLLARRAPG